MEQPVLVVDLENMQSGIPYPLLSAIGSAVRQIASIGIHNIILKSNDARVVSEFIKVTDGVTDVNFNIRTDLKSIQSFLEAKDRPIGRNSLSCCYHGAAEVVEHIGKLPMKIPVILRADNDNYRYLLEKIKVITDTNSNTLIIAARLEMNGNNNGTITWENLDSLYCSIIDLIREKPDKKILMDYGILPTRLLTEHPCNGYVCSHNTCHSVKNNLPRRLYINETGNIMPENISIKPEYYIGNILEGDFIAIMEEYKNSGRHQNFLALAKKVYTKWVQVCPYRVIHMSDLYMYMS